MNALNMNLFIAGTRKGVILIVDRALGNLEAGLVADWWPGEPEPEFWMNRNEQLRRYGFELSVDDIKKIIKFWTRPKPK